jgi:two-component system cell cycle response regulator DivK
VRDLNKKVRRILVIQNSSHLEGNHTLDSVSKADTDYPHEAGGDITVLLVEDTEDNRQMLRRLLELSGYHVVEATNGKEAVVLATQELPGIILMDLSLPFIDGLAATRQIRKLKELREVPIVAVSAHDSADFHSEALAAGCNAYITKPIDYGELERVINGLLPAR